MYPEPTNLWERIEYSTLGTTIAESTWMFPALETAHVIALVTVIGTIALVDLRLVGVKGHALRVSQLAKDTLPLTWGAFALAALTGGLLFCSKASSYMINPWFLGKMALLALAGLNMMYFHMTTWRTVEHWEQDPSFPTMAKVAGWLSLVFWLGVVFCGRAIGFTLGIFY
ncbi:hypothetical protein KK137_08885 [Croceibacterium sp. LX-88]|jgi:hypothetical protein|uniref:DUF2214 domain-containing protein n=1 Tax=Croceibacterium selenioxidans TaxID=2838833 RepID=A0ABS5W5E8_9SPHN|nr:hypothetical protein [Croceibacterium selenioxidans]MBT2134445.1 hypothetical protein [Croceibacterium selenioxidans]